MSRIVLLNKPSTCCPSFLMMKAGRTWATMYLSLAFIPQADSIATAGAVVLIDDGALQHKIANPDSKTSKTYWVQVEGAPTADDLVPISQGILLKDGITLPAKCQLGIGDYHLWPRNPPIRVRSSIPDTWLTLILEEGRNRQVRRMCAALGFPVLRLIRYRVGSWTLDGLESGPGGEV